MNRALQAALLLFLPLLLQSQGHVPPPVRTVCEVLQNIDQYRGKAVSVRGAIDHASNTFTVLGSDCEGTLVVSGHAWPKALHLQGDASELAHAIQGKGRGTVWVTLTGRLQALPSYENPYGLRLLAYGPLQAYAAELQIESVREIETR